MNFKLVVLIVVNDPQLFNMMKHWIYNKTIDYNINSPSPAKWYVTVLSQLLYLMQITLEFQPPYFQIIIENKWNNFNNEWNIILSPFAWKATCSKMTLNW